jgi:hypothetical protein
MKINITGRLEIKDNGQFKTLLAKFNPHEVSEQTAKALAKEGKATIVAEEKQAAKVVKAEKTEASDLSALSVKELREMALGLSIENAAELNKEALVQVLYQKQSEET